MFYSFYNKNLGVIISGLRIIILLILKDGDTGLLVGTMIFYSLSAAFAIIGIFFFLIFSKTRYCKVNLKLHRKIFINLLYIFIQFLKIYQNLIDEMTVSNYT
jgi:hypothetical protein